MRNVIWNTNKFVEERWDRERERQRGREKPRKMAKTNSSVIYIFACWCSGCCRRHRRCYHRLIVNIFVYLVTICDSKSPYKVILIFIYFFHSFFSLFIWFHFARTHTQTHTQCVCVILCDLSVECVRAPSFGFGFGIRIRFNLLCCVWSFTGMILHCAACCGGGGGSSVNHSQILNFVKEFVCYVCTYEHS